MQRKAASTISDKVKVKYGKLQTSPKGDSLTRSEKALEVTRERQHIYLV